METNKEKIVVLANYDNLLEAEIVKARLTDQGIECFLSDVNTALLGPFYLEKLAGIRLFVLDKDLENAQAILQEDVIFPDEN